MRIAVTGATGFLGRYIVARLAADGHETCCWYRPASDRNDVEGVSEWVEGGLREQGSAARLVEGCDAAVHAALDRPGRGFMGAEGALVDFVETNVLGSLRLIQAARSAGVKRFVFISTCAVHDVVLADRPLDEAHPTWMKSHYGAHKASIEAFVHSFGLGEGYPICALRPCGIYGLAHPAERSKWFELAANVARGADVDCLRGGKEVHAADVARAVGILLEADAAAITGQSYNCCDRYVSELEVATLARELTGSKAAIRGHAPIPKNQIVTKKIEALGMRFGGLELLRKTIGELVSAASRELKEEDAAGIQRD